MIPRGQTRGQAQQARTPPRGWNSYDSFIWTISEVEFLQNAQLVAQHLRPHGYRVLEYFTIYFIHIIKLLSRRWLISENINLISQYKCIFILVVILNSEHIQWFMKLYLDSIFFHTFKFVYFVKVCCRGLSVVPEESGGGIC